MNLHGLVGFCDWLAASSPSQTIQTVSWIIPAVQTVHILCVAAVMSSVLIVAERQRALENPVYAGNRYLQVKIALIEVNRA